MNRRNLLKSGLACGSALLLPKTLFANPLISRDTQRPATPSGLQTGDVLHDRAMVWCRSDRTARLWLEWDTDGSFRQPQKIRGPWALPENDYITRLDLHGLPANQQIHLRLSYRDADLNHLISEPLLGQFRTPSLQTRNIRFVWSGDTAGQGYGINPDWGGMRIYETMRQQQPDFFVHSGDTIYADGPIEETVTPGEGGVWKNIVTPEVSKVAETLHEYRGRYRYNLMDDNVRRFNAEVPQIWQWDDHEVTNNWSDSKQLDDRYQVKSVELLQARATRAFLDYAPMRHFDDRESERVYRYLPCGPLLDRFIVDMRSYRGPNGTNLQTTLDDDSAFMGRTQIAWLLAGLKASKATWKAVFADMPIGLQVPDGKTAEGVARWEAIANGDNGAPNGRELEMAMLLKAIKDAGIKNVVWFTADVHYTAAHHYQPDKAAFQDFEPFWEFVSGPLNAGSFGPNAPDNTFGLQVVYQKAPEKQNTSPLAGYQFFGQVDIDADDRSMTVRLKDVAGTTLFTQQLQPL